jgi:hypothetical protein
MLSGHEAGRGFEVDRSSLGAILNRAVEMAKPFIFSGGSFLGSIPEHAGPSAQASGERIATLLKSKEEYSFDKFLSDLGNPGSVFSDTDERIIAILDATARNNGDPYSALSSGIRLVTRERIKGFAEAIENADFETADRIAKSLIATGLVSKSRLSGGIKKEFGKNPDYKSMTKQQRAHAIKFQLGQAIRRYNKNRDGLPMPTKSRLSRKYHVKEIERKYNQKKLEAQAP